MKDLPQPISDLSNQQPPELPITLFGSIHLTPWSVLAGSIQAIMAMYPSITFSGHDRTIDPTTSYHLPGKVVSLGLQGPSLRESTKSSQICWANPNVIMNTMAAPAINTWFKFDVLITEETRREDFVVSKVLYYLFLDWARLDHAKYSMSQSSSWNDCFTWSLMRTRQCI